METARISLKRTPRFRLAPRGGQNGARPGYGAILHEECALDALKGGFWLPGRFVCIRGRAPAQDGHPSAGAALGVPNANLPVGWSLSTTPSPKPHVPQSVGVRAGCPRPVWVGLLSGWGVSNLYQPLRKAISAFLGPSPDLLLEDPVAGRPTPPWAPRRGTRSPDIDSGLVRGVFVRLRVRSCIVPKGIHEGWYPANTERHL